VIEIGQVTLGVSDLEESEAFYRDVLGLDTARAGEDVQVRWPNFVLRLTHNPPAGRGKFYVGFRVANAAAVDEWAQRLRSKGAQIVSGPAQHDGAYQLFFLDPDSYEIKIYAE
jgi:catechol 2,3-dioxygenase-like lactoylglutathione lyase family enzyme